MKPDSQAIIHEFGPKDIKVWVCGDVHIGAEGFQQKEFEKWLDRIMNDDDSYVVFIGDLMDTATKNSVGDVFHGMNPQEQMEYLGNALKPLAMMHKILAIIPGNHELRVAKDTSIEPIYDICVRLGIEDVYRRDYAAIRIRLKRNTNDLQVYNLIAFHGGSDFKVRQMANNVEGFDAILTGHSHQPVTRMPAHLVLTQRGVVELKEIVQVTGCSWCDYTGYGARNMFQPQVQSRPQCLVLEFPSSRRYNKRISLAW